MVNKIFLITIVLLLVTALYIYIGPNFFELTSMEEEETPLEPIDTEAMKDSMNTTMPSEDDQSKYIPDPIMEQMIRQDYAYSGELKDVTGGNATGTAKADYGTEYFLYVTFENLLEPEGTDFYEGWIVRSSPFNFISTGRVQKIAGQYMNLYNSDQDLTDHDFYVLTIEPDDNDPAPAGHVVEGRMTKN